MRSLLRKQLSSGHNPTCLPSGIWALYIIGIINATQDLIKGDTGGNYSLWSGCTKVGEIEDAILVEDKKL